MMAKKKHERYPGTTHVAPGEEYVPEGPEWIWVTPELAKWWMEGAENYRNLTQRRIEEYAGVMARGEWNNNTGQSICLHIKDDKCCDGAHRLLALIRSGATIRFAVVPKVSQVENIDTGKPRGMQDVLRHHGCPDATAVAALIRSVDHLKQLPKIRYGARVQNEQGLRIWEANKEGWAFYTRLGKRCRMIMHGPAVGGFLYHACKGVPHQAAAEFVELLKKNREHDNHPITVLNKKLRMLKGNRDESGKGKLGGGMSSRVLQFRLLAKTWNAWLQGKDITQLRMGTFAKEWHVIYPNEGIFDWDADFSLEDLD